MNHFSFRITAYYRLEILERILRVIRHRGAHIVSMKMCENADSTLLLEVTLSSDRPAELLYSQLNKLIDVIKIEIMS